MPAPLARWPPSAPPPLARWPPGVRIVGPRSSDPSSRRGLHTVRTTFVPRSSSTSDPSPRRGLHAARTTFVSSSTSDPPAPPSSHPRPSGSTSYEKESDFPPRMAGGGGNDDDVVEVSCGGRGGGDPSAYVAVLKRKLDLYCAAVAKSMDMEKLEQPKVFTHAPDTKKT